MDPRLRVAVFKFTGCAGCQMELIRLGDDLLKLLEKIDFNYWYMVKRENIEGFYDISLIEGSVSTPREIEELKEIRENSRVLVAFGDCAIGGCIPSIKDWLPEREVEGRVYEDPSHIRSIKVRGIGEYVDVDHYLPGCPPHKDTILDLLKALILGVKPKLRSRPVCVECKLKEIPCLITMYGKPCMGPVTHGGCGAICPSHGRPCEGCYGPMSDPNPKSLAMTFKELGLSDADIVRKFRKYAGLMPEFREEAGLP